VSAEPGGHIACLAERRTHTHTVITIPVQPLYGGAQVTMMQMMCLLTARSVADDGYVLLVQAVRLLQVTLCVVRNAVASTHLSRTIRYDTTLNVRLELTGSQLSLPYDKKIKKNKEKRK